MAAAILHATCDIIWIWIVEVILWSCNPDYSNIRRSADCLVLGMTVCISHSKLLCPNCSNIQHVKLFQSRHYTAISYYQGPNTSRETSFIGSGDIGTLLTVNVGDSKRGRRVESATRASGIASHAPQIRPKIAAILACNIVTALSQCRHVRL